MRQALVDLDRGEGLQPLRSVVRPSGLPGFMVLMPGALPTALGAKVLGIFPANPSRGKDAHQGIVLLLSPETGELTAVLDASAVTAVRTAAVSAVATDALARPDATRLTVVGSGLQARWHVEAMAAVRPLRRIVLTARDPAKARALAEHLGSSYGPTVEVIDDPGEAVATADIVVTATAATEPVFPGGALPAGVHINAVGACVPTARELDEATLRRARVYVDRRESALAEAGDLIRAGLGAEHIVGELGEVLTGAAPGRQTRQDVTIFESLGLAVEDLAAAAHVEGKARAQGRGTLADF